MQLRNTGEHFFLIPHELSVIPALVLVLASITFIPKNISATDHFISL